MELYISEKAIDHQDNISENNIDDNNIDGNNIDDNTIDGDSISDCINNTSENYYSINNTILYEQDEYLKLNNNGINLILEYYKIPKKKQAKTQKILDIILFEQNNDNIDIVNKRKILWECIKNIQDDNYLKKYLLIKI